MIKLICFALLISLSISQKIQKLKDIHFNVDGNDIQKFDLFSDDKVSGFLLFIKKEVKAHIHENHNETVYIMSGKANFYLNNKWHEIGEGDILYIPKSTTHAVNVVSEEPLKVISIQAPKFVGKDRIFKNILKEK